MYLHRCIKSILTQNYENFELILINDGSTDSSLKIINEYKNNDNRVRIINKKNEGANIARKKGIEFAKGEWILFIDSDDEVTENSMNNLCTYIRDDIDMIIGSFKYLKSSKDIHYTIYPYKEEESIKYTKSLLKKKIHVGVWARLIRKNIFDSFIFDIPSNIIYGEDFIMNIRLGQKCRKIILIPNIVYNYIYRPNSIVAKKNYDKNYETCFQQILCKSILPENERLIKIAIKYHKWRNLKSMIKRIIIKPFN